MTPSEKAMDSYYLKLHDLISLTSCKLLGKNHGNFIQIGDIYIQILKPLPYKFLLKIFVIIAGDPIGWNFWKGDKNPIDQGI